MKIYLIKSLLLLLVISSMVTSRNGFALDTDKVLDNKVKVTEISYAKQLTFYSDILQENQSMNVYLPSNFDIASSEHTYPVVFINGGHGSKFFLTLSGIVKHMSELDRMPESIVVSLNSGGYSPSVYTNGMWRSRDKLNGDAEPEKYIQHLTQELFPFLENRYRASDHRTIVGVSGSALFPLYSFTHAPEIFDNYILLAAMDMIGMGYVEGENIIDLMQKTLKKQIKKGADIPSSFYFAMSDDDLDDEEGRYNRNILNLKQKMNTFAGNNFKFELDVIANERHYDAFIKAMLSSIELMYPVDKWAPKYRDLAKSELKGIKGIDNHYEKLSAEYGFTILPKADRWNSANSLKTMGFFALRDGRYSEALDYTNRWIKYRPESVRGYDQLSEVYEAKQHLQQALNAKQKVIELARKQIDPQLKNYQQELVELNNRIQGK